MRPLVIAWTILTMLSTTLTLGQDAPPAPKDKFSGYMFGDFFYNVARDPAFTGSGSLSNSSASGEKAYQGFQLRRIYFTYDNAISDKFSTRLRLEMDAGGARDIKIVPFVKDAYLKWKNVIDGGDFIFGIQPTTAFEVSEGSWGYRSLEKTILDLRGIIPSRDFGVALKGKFDGGGTVNYHFLVANGYGNKNQPKDKQHRYAATILVKPGGNLLFTVTGDFKSQAAIPDPANSTATLSNGVFTGSVFAGYSDPGHFSLGAEGFMQSTANGFTPSTATAPKSLMRMGVSAWAAVNLNPDVQLVGRYDLFDPNTDSDILAKGDSRNLIIGALAWKPDKNVTVMPNVLIETYESAPAPSTATFDASVTGRLTFYYNFL